jgi:hypothetical protein
LDNTQLSAQAGIANIENTPEAMPFITGQSAAVAKQANLALQTIGIQQNAAARTLASMQATRGQKLEAAKFLYDANRNNLNDTIALYKATAPDNIGTVTDPNTGETTVIMKNPITGAVTKQSLGQLTTPQVDTQVVDVNNRKVLINTRTGDVIRVLGSSSSSGNSTVTDGYRFTATQLNKGAANASLPLDQFKNLSGEDQNFYINNYASFNKFKKILDDDIKSLGREAIGPDRQEIDSSDLPQYAKEQLKTYLEENAPKPEENKKHWWEFWK